MDSQSVTRLRAAVLDLLSHRPAAMPDRPALERLAVELIEHLLIADACAVFRLLAAQGGDAGARFNLAAGLRMLGELDEAATLCRGVLRERPEFAPAYHLMGDLAEPAECADWARAAERLLDAPSLAPAEPPQLHYAAGLLHHKAGDYAAAFAQVSRGAALLRARSRYRIEDDLLTLRAIGETQSRTALSAIPAGGETRSGVFVCGMPRSGTTLVEQMLLRAGGKTVGESPALSAVLQRHLRSDLSPAPQTRLELTSRLIELDTQRLGGSYVEAVAPIVGTSGLFVDKALQNYLAAGLITRALPQARVVLVRRGAKDRLASIFRTYFAGLYPFALDPLDLAAYIRGFDALADHWRDTLDPALYREVDYERLVSAPADEGKALFAFLGLPWDPAVLRPKARDVAVSASAAQVRKPIGTGAIGAWRHYEPWLGKALALLDA